MRREQRLRQRRDFETVSKHGRPYHAELFSLRVHRNELPVSRFGLAVSKRVGKAVVRNTVKRRLREAIRALRPEPGWDVVVSARARAAVVDYDELVGALRSLFLRARLLRRDRADAARTTEPS